MGYGKYIMEEFEFESGEILKDVQVEYSFSGTPKIDERGRISNLIVYCHGFTGRYYSLDDIYDLTRKDAPLDKDKYCFISITSLGFPESCSPSTTGLKRNFPKYSIKDRVNFKRQFIKEKFGCEHVHGIFGRGVGGYECYTWAGEYPDEMDFLIIGTSSFKTNGYRYVVSKGFDSIIESSDDYYDDTYSESLSRIMVSINKLLYSSFFSKRIFQRMSRDEIDVLMDDFVEDGLFVDIYDFKYRNDVVLEYDVEDKLKNIKVPVLIFSPADDIYFSPEFDTLPLKELIKDSTVVLFDVDVDDNYTEYVYHEPLSEEIKKFLEKINN